MKLKPKTNPKPKPILLLAVGNESRGDDALGPLLARRLAVWLEKSGRAALVEVIEEFQLQIENSLDIEERELVLCVDAGHQTPSPFVFYEARARSSDSLTSHAIAPEMLLDVFASVHAFLPPPVFILCLAGQCFDLGEPLSAVAVKHLELAFVFCTRLLERPDLAVWRECVEVNHA